MQVKISKHSHIHFSITVIINWLHVHLRHYHFDSMRQAGVQLVVQTGFFQVIHNEIMYSMINNNNNLSIKTVHSLNLKAKEVPYLYLFLLFLC